MKVDERHRVLVDLGVRSTLHKNKAQGRSKFDPDTLTVEFGAN